MKEVPVEKLAAVKTYHFSGDDVRISFSEEDPEPELIYEDKQGKRQFTGREIYRDKTQLGFLPSVVLQEVPDLHTLILSLAVPAANRPENVKSIPVETFAVRTKIRTSFAGPGTVEGQIQSHETIALKGNAW